MKRVTGNLHVTTLGHGYMSWEHTGHHRQYIVELVMTVRINSGTADMQRHTAAPQ